MKRKKKSSKLKISRENRVGIGSGILGFIFTVVLGDLSSKNVNETFNFSPLEIAEAFSGVMQVIGIPRFIGIILGWIFLFVPAVFFYFIAKWTYRKL
jgi:preprotein translocase subunit SecY